MRHRWVICSLLFTGAPIIHADRQVLAVQKSTLARASTSEKAPS
jgi:hypothetical protein